jgi:Tol biopolymer transport system component
VLVVLFAGSAAVFLRERAGDVQRSSTATRRLWQLTSSGRLAGEPAWSPDGQSVAYSADRDGNFDIWVQPLAAASPIRVTDSPARDWQPAWSPDGRQIAFRSERDGGGLFVVASDGGTPRRVSDFGDEPQWSPDGSRLLFTGAGGCYLVSPGSQPVAVLQDVIPRIAGRFHTAWHPDGRRISVHANGRTNRWTFWTAPVDGGPAVESHLSPSVADALRASGLALGRFSWSPSGDALYFEGQAGQTSNLWRIEVDGATLEWVAGPERLTTASTIDTRPQPSPDGTRLAFGSRIERTSAWSLPFDPVAGRVLGEGERVTPEGANTEILDMTPDGRRLVYRVNARDRQELWMRSLDGGADRLRASETAASIVQPRWSRDGTQLAYIRRPIDALRSPAVVLLGPEDEDERVLRATPAPEMIYDWSADGRSLLVRCRTASTNFAICLLPGTAGSDRAADMRVVAAAEGQNLYAAKFSPDERWISFIAATSFSRSTVFVSPAAGGAWIPITEARNFEDKPRWSPDGRTLYFLSNRNGFWNLWGRRFDSPGGKPVGAPFQVTTFDSSVHMIGNDVANLQIAVTRERLILPITEASGAIWVLEGMGE